VALRRSIPSISADRAQQTDIVLPETLSLGGCATKEMAVHDDVQDMTPRMALKR
jgi:hypothetical protein